MTDYSPWTSSAIMEERESTFHFQQQQLNSTVLLPHSLTKSEILFSYQVKIQTLGTTVFSLLLPWVLFKKNYFGVGIIKGKGLFKGGIIF